MAIAGKQRYPLYLNGLLAKTWAEGATHANPYAATNTKPAKQAEAAAEAEAAANATGASPDPATGPTTTTP